MSVLSIYSVGKVQNISCGCCSFHVWTSQKFEFQLKLTLSTLRSSFRSNWAETVSYILTEKHVLMQPE